MAAIPRHPASVWDASTPGSGTNPPPYTERKTSLNATQRLERKLAELDASGKWYKRWIYEIITWLISALCMISLLVILLLMKNRRLADSRSGNAVYTVLSKTASAALLLPTSEAIGQLKWHWFNKQSREIWDFEIFDKASRGAWGSILLLFRTKGRSLAALGAMLTLLLIANDTFFQQAVQTSERWQLQGIGSVAKTFLYKPRLILESRSGSILVQNDQYLRSTLWEYFYDNGTQPIPFGNETRPEIPVSCPTSNCTFPEYETLGVCSQCTDISSSLKFSCRTGRVDWISNLTGLLAKHEYPNGTMCGYFLEDTGTDPILLSGYTTAAISAPNGSAPAGEALLLRMLPMVDVISREELPNGSVNFKDIRNPISDFLVVAADSAERVYRNRTPVAQECVLYWCIKRMKSSYLYGTYKEDVVSAFTNSTPGSSPWKSYRIDDPSHPGYDYYYTENITITSPSNRLEYGMTNRTHMNVYSNFNDILPSFLTVANSSAKPTFRTRTYAKGQPYYRNLVWNPWIPPNNVTRHIERLAASLTDLIRSNHKSNQMVEGEAYNIETFVHIKWEWLSFPFALLLLTLVFLIATIIKTSKEGASEAGPGAWKTSALPTLIYSLPKDVQSQFNSTAHSEGALGGKQNVRIRLHPKNGWRVSGHSYSPGSPVVVLRSDQPPPG
ncbi:hypothetical protein CC80DRAFT_479345 [Byssothecium circinans]|uniref:DUF3176 domain containing protein n=1 Tax=Byssothecium circinans TaxID=147558 RepID=A0A6A5TI74_9PLEO|nr:hypothetical protein CC80DRAFT_479345 [Byssothecium circinans]